MQVYCMMFHKNLNRFIFSPAGNLIQDQARMSLKSGSVADVIEDSYEAPLHSCPFRD